ncbi:MAG TPA: hypothetical protein VK470_05655 [Bacteroidota bacterium]|nr:hypothetical protein [Bacteroidota bacterium]
MNYWLTRSSDRILETAAAGFLTLAILSFVSPQVGQLGHGLRTTIPALMISAVFILYLNRSAFSEALSEYGMVFVLGLVFLMQAFARFMYATESANLTHTFVEGPLLTLVTLLWILAYSRTSNGAMRRLRTMLLFGWCLSLALGVPTLLDRPGVARTTMGNIFANENAAVWAPFGVGEYTIYTALGVCFAPLLLHAKNLNGWLRVPAIALVMLSAVAVIMSTFTMAAAILVLSFTGTLFVWTLEVDGIRRVLRSMLVVVPLAMLPLLYNAAGEYRQTKFIVDKFERLYEGLSSAGLAKGDETQRGEWFVEEMEEVWNEPFLGYIPHVTGVRGHGHSSLSNSLVLFGVFGTGVWIVFLLKMFRASWNGSTLVVERYGLAIGYLVLFLAGILNPIWHAQASLAALFVMTIPDVAMDQAEGVIGEAGNDEGQGAYEY